MGRKKEYLAWIPISEIVLMKEGNRRVVNHARVREIGTNFDPDAFGQLCVSEKGAIIDEKYPPDKHVAADGQHRLLAITKIMGWDGSQKLPCIVDPNLTTKGGLAKKFRLLNRRVAVRPVDDFKAALLGGVDWAVRINTVIQRFGFRVDATASSSVITAVHALRFLFDAGEEVLSNAISTATTAWGRTTDAVQGDVLRGLGLMFRRYREQPIDKAALAEKLRKLPGGPSHLIGRARGSRDTHGSTVAHNIAAIVVVAYNKGRRTQKLPDWWTAK